MLDVAEEHKKKKISTSIVKGVYDAPTADQADKCIALIPLEKGKYWYVLFYEGLNLIWILIVLIEGIFDILKKKIITFTSSFFEARHGFQKSELKQLLK